MHTLTLGTYYVHDIFTDVNCPTGTKESYQQAFAWRKYVVHHVLHKANKTQHECERTCECLHSLGLLLEDHSCRGASIPELDSYDTHLLAVGAYMTGLRQFDANAGVISWICSHVEVCSTASLCP